MNIFQIQKSIKPIHCVKTFQLRSFFLVRIQSECWKIRTRKNSLFGQFSRSDTLASIEKRCIPDYNEKQSGKERKHFPFNNFIFNSFMTDVPIIK